MFSILDSELWNCKEAFSKLCPKQWSELQPTETPGVRFCNVCFENVSYCTTPEEFIQLGNAGNCVAIPDQQRGGSLERILLGRPSVSEMNSILERQKRASEWWSDAIKLGPDFENERFEQIAKLFRLQGYSDEGISKEYREYLIGLKRALDSGPEALCRALLIKPNGKREKLQNIIRCLQSHFELTIRECNELVRRCRSSEEK